MMVSVEGSDTTPFDVAQRDALSASVSTFGLMRPTSDSCQASALNEDRSSATDSFSTDSIALATNAGAASSAAAVGLTASVKPSAKPAATSATVNNLSRPPETR